jgi:DNA-binding SARP family transcriptional activator
MGESWRIELLGGLRAQRGDRVITHFETRKIAALLACLALRLHRAQPRELLAEQLWPEEDWEATRNRLRQGLSSLRQTLEPGGSIENSVLVTDRAEAGLDPAAVTTDVQEFEAALASAAAACSMEEGIAALRRAVALYQGELLPGYYEEWVLAERERLAEAYQDALASLANALGEAGDRAGAIEAGRRLVAANPLREDGHAGLMRSYAAAGRASEALRQYRELERILREELDTSPSTATRTLLEELRSGTVQPAARVGVRAEGAPHLSTPTAPLRDLEPEGGAVPLDSPFYIARPTDEGFRAAIARRDSIVLVKGPRQIGKTSLLARGLHQAREAGASVVLTDLQKLDPDQLVSAAALFQTLAEMIIDQLDLDICLEDVWNPRRGWNVNFERLLRRDVLGALSSPLVWGLDEVDRLFAYPFSDVVFGLFRSWHNERALNPEGPWGRLTLTIAYATEAHLFIKDLNQSPFNVGTRLTLEDFTRGEVEELNHRYGSPLADGAETARFFRLVGGHPYLVRRGLHALAAEGADPDALESLAGSSDGPFGDHLRRMVAVLAQDADLCDAVRAVLHGRPCPTETSFYRLRSAGVIAGTGAAEARPRCRLYQLCLEKYLL